MNPTEMTYRKTALQGASGFGLLIALYDTLAGNLRRASDAQRGGDIEKRCQELNHALLVIGYLEDWIDRKQGGELARQLITFYANLRAKLIEAQVRQSAQILDQEMAVILAIRGTWQDIEARTASTLELSASSEILMYPAIVPSQEGRGMSSWSA
jgi:flagellar secretion chaperone FliS